MSDLDGSRLAVALTTPNSASAEIEYIRKRRPIHHCFLIKRVADPSLNTELNDSFKTISSIHYHEIENVRPPLE